MQRQLKGRAWMVLSLIAAGSSIYHIWTGVFGQPEAYLHRVIHVTFMFSLSLMAYPVLKNRDTDRFPWYDGLILLFWLTSMGYIFYHYEWISEHIGHVDTFSVFDKILASRHHGRCLGVLPPGHRMAADGPHHPRRRLCLRGAVDALVVLPPGLFGLSGGGQPVFPAQTACSALPTGISATFIFLFIVFGAFLEKSGFGQFTIDFATAVAGQFRGGPAKVAVLSSGLMGSISGSSTAERRDHGVFHHPQ